MLWQMLVKIKQMGLKSLKRSRSPRRILCWPLPPKRSIQRAKREQRQQCFRPSFIEIYSHGLNESSQEVKSWEENQLLSYLIILDELGKTRLQTVDICVFRHFCSPQRLSEGCLMALVQFMKSNYTEWIEIREPQHRVWEWNDQHHIGLMHQALCQELGKSWQVGQESKDKAEALVELKKKQLESQVEQLSQCQKILWQWHWGIFHMH